MSIAVLGDHFYRLYVSSLERGSAVEERESLPELLAALDAAHIVLTRTVSTLPGELRLEGTNKLGHALQVTISYYRRVDPPEGWNSRFLPEQDGA